MVFFGSNPIPFWKAGKPVSYTTVLTLSRNVLCGLEWGIAGDKTISRTLKLVYMTIAKYV